MGFVSMSQIYWVANLEFETLTSMNSIITHPLAFIIQNPPRLRLLITGRQSTNKNKKEKEKKEQEVDLQQCFIGCRLILCMSRHNNGGRCKKTVGKKKKKSIFLFQTMHKTFHQIKLKAPTHDPKLDHAHKYKRQHKMHIKHVGIYTKCC